MQAKTHLQAKNEGRVLRLVACGISQIGRNDRYLQQSFCLTQYKTFGLHSRTWKTLKQKFEQAPLVRT